MQCQAPYLFLPVDIFNLKVSALLDSGSSVNIISNSFFKRLPVSVQSTLRSCNHDTLTLANNQNIQVLGTARIPIKTPLSKEKHNIIVYVLDAASHPLILGCQYFHSKGVILNFSTQVYQCDNKTVKVTTKTAVTIAPNSEVTIVAKVPKKVLIGQQGVCTAHQTLTNKGVLLAKSLCSVSISHTIPVRILNMGNESIYLGKGFLLAIFTLIDDSFDVTKVECSNVKLQENSDFDKFKSCLHVEDNLTSDQKDILFDKVCEYKSIFVTDDNPNLGYTNVVEHKITLKQDFVSKHHRPYRLPPDKREVLRHQLNELLRQGIITQVDENENLPITSPIVLVTKRSKPSEKPDEITKEYSLSSYRFCCDFRFLNSQMENSHFNFPDLQELTESFSERTPNFMTSIDLSSGFFQMPISPESTKYTAFNTCFGTYKFLRLPMGLRTSPHSFQMLMDKVLDGLTFKSLLCYLDDILVCSETFEEHMKDLTDLFERLRDSGLKLNPSKCKFATSKCEFLGHEISREGIKPPSQKVDKILNYPIPKNIKELRRVLGMFNWFRKFVPNYSMIVSPLTKLTRKNVKFQWNSEQQAAFDDLKQRLINSPALAFPRYDLEFHIAVDTSCKGIGYILYQIHEDNTKRIVRFGSKGLSKWQQSYGPTKLELLGMVTSILDCASYVRGRHFIVECDHQALRPLFQKKFKGAIYERWLALLQQFNFDIVYKPAAQMCVPDALSRKTVFSENIDSSPEEEDPHFPYVQEKIKEGTLPSGETLSSLLKQKSAVNFVKLSVKNDFEEYDADTEDNFPFAKDKNRLRPPTYSKRVRSPLQDKTVLKGLFPVNDNITETNNNNGEVIKQVNCPEVVTTDTDNTDISHVSSVVIQTDQQGESSCPNNEVSSIELSESCSSTTDLIDTDYRIINASLLKEFDFSQDKFKLLQRSDNNLIPLINYLLSGQLPKSQKLAREVLLKQNDYALFDGILFHSRVAKAKRTKCLAHYQLVVPEVLIKKVLELYHDSTMAAHGGIQDTLDKIKEVYFFEKMSTIVSDYVKSCLDCQKRKHTNVTTKSKITALPTPSRPFDVWQIDLYGPLTLTRRGNIYLFTAVDMFSKFIFVNPLANKDAVTVSNALFNLFTTFGICDTVISDKGSEFIARVTKEVCAMLGIEQQFTPSFVHHCLGACERTHSTLAERLTPYMKSHYWDEIVPAITFAMNSSQNSALGYSPFEVIFGQRPKFPLTNNLIPKDLQTLPKDVRSYVSLQREKLKTIQEHMKQNITESQVKMIDNANKHIDKETVFEKSDYVFLSEQPTGQGQKLKHKFSGPYVIQDIATNHMVQLRDPTGKRQFPDCVHKERLKPAYIRQPNPSPYFKVIKSTKDIQFVNAGTQTTKETDPVTQPIFEVRRSQRQIQKPIRYRDVAHVDPTADIATFSLSSDSDGCHKIKRVLAQRQFGGRREYLVHISGEPAENAIWVPLYRLNAKARSAIETRPPPLL